MAISRRFCHSHKNSVAPASRSLSTWHCAHPLASASSCCCIVCEAAVRAFAHLAQCSTGTVNAPHALVESTQFRETCWFGACRDTCCWFHPVERRGVLRKPITATGAKSVPTRAAGRHDQLGRQGLVGRGHVARCVRSCAWRVRIARNPVGELSHSRKVPDVCACCPPASSYPHIPREGSTSRPGHSSTWEDLGAHSACALVPLCVSTCVALPQPR